MRDVHWCVTVDYQQIANGNIANQIYGFTIDYGKFILITISSNMHLKMIYTFAYKVLYLTISLRPRVFYEQIVNEAQLSWLSLVENEGD